MTKTSEELCDVIARALKGHVDDPGNLAKGILHAFARITDAEIANEASRNMQLILLGPRGFSGASRKPGNIYLNWRTLFKKMPELVLTGAGVTQIWLIPFAALYLWNLICSASRINISEDHGMVMYALWSHDPDNRQFEEDSAQDIVNTFCYNNQLPPFDLVTLRGLLTDLARLGCIEITDGKILLREWIKRPN